MKPEAPPRKAIPDVRETPSFTAQVETINGRAISRYRNAAGRVIYAVGGVGFYHLDEARLYAKGETLRENRDA